MRRLLTRNSMELKLASIDACIPCVITAGKKVTRPVSASMTAPVLHVVPQPH